jgi:glycosyltransferase involved in cell wall biosynthesis
VSHPTYSIVVPIHNEQETLNELQRRLADVFPLLDGEAEVLLIDDGSTDASYPLMLELHRRDPRFKTVQLARNFGHQLAITAGIDLACGDAVVVMDGDLQHPPEVLPQLAAQWRSGYEVVFGVMTDRPEGWAKRVTARGYYRMLRKLANVEIPAAAGDFRLVDRRVVEAFRAMPERNRFVRGMFAWLGFQQVAVPYAAPTRYAGSSKYTLRKMLHLATDGLISFSTRPLRLALDLGFVVSGLSFLFGIASLVSKFAGAFLVPGWLTIVLVTSFIGGIQLVVIGVVGEYVGRIYDEVKARPLYLVRELRGFGDDDSRLASRSPAPHTELAQP